MKCQAETVLPTVLYHFFYPILPAVTFTSCTYNRRETWILSETCNDAGQRDDIIMRSK